MSRQVPESFPGARLVSYERIHRHGHDIKIRLVPGGVILLVKPSNGNVGSDLCTRDHGRDFDSRVHGQPSNPLLVIFGVYERQAEDLTNGGGFPPDENRHW